MPMIKTCSLRELIDKLDGGKLHIDFAHFINPYWKRPFAWSSERHRYPWQELNFVIKGRIYGTIEESRVYCGSGDLFWLAPETEHSLTWPKDLIYYSFRFDISDGDTHYTIDRPWLFLRNTTGLEPYFRQIATIEKLTSTALYRDTQLRAWWALLLIEMQSRLEGVAGSTARNFTDYQRQAILGLCAEQRYTGLDSGQLAEQFGFSQDYFSRLFKATFGASFKSWIFTERMKHAAMLLLDGKQALSEVGAYFGYEDVYLFSREFKKVMGMTPRQYQTRNRLVLNRTMEGVMTSAEAD
jgi:AraC-like DNA-binding protein